jgi:hypothetical protein
MSTASPSWPAGEPGRSANEMRVAVLIILCAVCGWIVFSVLPFATSVLRYEVCKRGFEQVMVGDSRDHVIALMGTPDIELSGQTVRFHQPALPPCEYELCFVFSHTEKYWAIAFDRSSVKSRK